MDSLVNNYWMLFGICLKIVSAQYIFGYNSAQPTDQIHTDPTGASCDVFSYSSSGAKFTKIRKNVTLASGTSKVKVTGLTLGCNSTSAATYVLPLTAAHADKWNGPFARCRLEEALPDTASPQFCVFSCDCPSEGCTHVQFSHLPKTSEWTGITLCSFDIASCEDHFCQNGATCMETYGGYDCECPPGYSGTTCETKLRDCEAHKQAGNTVSGQYTIILVTGRQVLVHCDMDTDGGGWTVLLRRQGGTVDFDRDWNDYKLGFGNDAEFWIGNDIIHELTTLNQQQYKLHIDLVSPSNGSKFATYDTFSVADEASNYELTVGGYTGDAAEGLIAQHNGMKFTTKDQDNDMTTTKNCATSYTGGWWYNACVISHLTGMYGQGHGYAQGIVWRPWLGGEISMDYADMKIRPL